MSCTIEEDTQIPTNHGCYLVSFSVNRSQLFYPSLKKKQVYMCGGERSMSIFLCPISDWVLWQSQGPNVFQGFFGLSNSHRLHHRHCPLQVSFPLFQAACMIWSQSWPSGLRGARDQWALSNSKPLVKSSPKIFGITLVKKERAPVSSQDSGKPTKIRLLRQLLESRT